MKLGGHYKASFVVLGNSGPTKLFKGINLNVTISKLKKAFEKNTRNFFQVPWSLGLGCKEGICTPNSKTVLLGRMGQAWSFRHYDEPWEHG